MSRQTSVAIQPDTRRAGRRRRCVSIVLLCIVSCGVALMLSVHPVPAADTWDRRIEALDKLFDQSTVDIEKTWDDVRAREEADWEKQRKAVLAKWNAHLMPTPKKWVSYSRDLSSRSRVDFERGTVTIETTVPVDAPVNPGRIEQRIQKQAAKLLGEKKMLGQSVVADQLANKKGQAVTPKNSEAFIKEEVLPRIESDPVASKTADGRSRKVYRVELKMVPEHLRIRARKFMPAVAANAKRFNVSAQLILAIIHTESCFNPMARSHCNAIGLMQVIPRYAGREAYRYIHDKDAVLPADYLQDPERNIELGTAYLHLLAKRYFRSVPANPKNRYLTICGYNWGPTAMHKKILARFRVHEMADQSVYKLLRSKTPKETRDYLERVTSRMPMYAAMIDHF